MNKKQDPLNNLTTGVSVLVVGRLVSAKGWQKGLACGGVRTLFLSWPHR